MSAKDISLSKILPPDINGWEISGTEKIYTPETLYDYIDGGAELYLSYGMNDVASVLYSKAGIGTIRVELFDMISSENAFGVFTHTRLADEKEFGQGSQYFTGAQIFWKDRYLVTIIGDDENKDIKETIKKIAVIIDSQISKKGDLPLILSLLPQKNLVADGYCYFHHYIWQNIYYFISNDNIFDISDSTNAVIARYSGEDGKYILLIVEYSDSVKAENAYLSVSKELLKGASSIRNTDDSTWIKSIYNSNYLIAVFKAPSEASANEILSGVQDIIHKN